MANSFFFEVNIILRTIELKSSYFNQEMFNQKYIALLFKTELR